jgi:hypothetical protein
MIDNIPIAENKDLFQLRQSGWDSIDRKLSSIHSIQPHLRSSHRGAFKRSNMSVFLFSVACSLGVRRKIACIALRAMIFIV